MDIKPPNFILTKGQLKVIDLGCAEQIPQNQDFVLSNSSKGTEGYMAPECFITYNNKRFQYSTRWAVDVNVRFIYPYDYRTDSYSLGILLTYLRTRIKDKSDKVETYLKNTEDKCNLKDQFARPSSEEMLISMRSGSYI